MDNEGSRGHPHLSLVQDKLPGVNIVSAIWATIIYAVWVESVGGCEIHCSIAVRVGDARWLTVSLLLWPDVGMGGWVRWVSSMCATSRQYPALRCGAHRCCIAFVLHVDIPPGGRKLYNMETMTTRRLGRELHSFPDLCWGLKVI